VSRLRRDEILAWCLDRLNLDKQDLYDGVDAPLTWWQERAARDPAAATVLSVLLAASGTRRLRICSDRPSRYSKERHVVLEHAVPGVRAQLLDRLERLWDLAPYVASLEARSACLRELGAPAQMVELADLLSQLPLRSLRSASLPGELLRAGDAERVDTIRVAERIDQLAEEALAALQLDWLPGEIRRLVPPTNRARVLRELFSLHSASLALLGCYSRAHPRRHARGETLIVGMHQLNRLLEVAGRADHDPLYGLEIMPAQIELTVADVTDFEAALEADYFRLLEALGPKPRAKDITRTAKSITAGLNVLLDILEAARAEGAHIESLPCVHLVVGEGFSRSYGYLQDGYFPEPHELAEIIALGIDELSAPEDQHLLIAFLTAVVTLCRPKECMPCCEDVAPLGVHKMIYLDPETGKTGARELYVPATAVALFGFGQGWFGSRSWVDPHPVESLGLGRARKRRPKWHATLPKDHTDQARATLEKACMRVRKRYQQETGKIISDRLAYMIRKFVSAYLWRARIRPADALSDVLGHEDLSGDRPYTLQSESEVLEQNTTLIGMVRRWGEKQ